MNKTLDAIVDALPAHASSKPRTVVVDCSDLFGAGAIFTYREPNLHDLFAASDPTVLREWRKHAPEITDTLAMQLELIARLHISPPSEQAVGALYLALLQRLPTAQAVAFLRRAEQAITSAFGLVNLEEAIDEKKSRS